LETKHPSKRFGNFLFIFLNSNNSPPAGGELIKKR